MKSLSYIDSATGVAGSVGVAVQMEDGQETRQRMANDKLSMSELATTALVALPPVVPLAELAETLRSCRFQTFPISPDVNAALCSGKILVELPREVYHA